VAYDVPDEAASKPVRVKCKKCGHAFTAGGPTQVQPKKSSGVQQKVAAKSRPQRPAKAEADYDLPAKKRPTYRPTPKPGVPILMMAIPLGIILFCGIAVAAYFIISSFVTASSSVAQNTTSSQPSRDDSPKDNPPKDNPPKDNPPKDKPDDVKPPEPKKPLYTLKTPPKQPLSSKARDPIDRLVLLPDGKTAAVVESGQLVGQRSVWLLNLTNGTVGKKFPLVGFSVKAIVLMKDGKSVLVGGSDDRLPRPQPEEMETLHLVNVETGAVTPVLTGKTNPIHALAVSSDGTLVAVREGDPDHSLRVLEIATGKERFRKDKIHEVQMPEAALALTPDNRFLISAGLEGEGEKVVSKVIVWDIVGGKEKHVFRGYPGKVEAVALSSDGTLLAAAFHDGAEGGSARVWDVESGAEKLSIVPQGNRFGARCVLFGPDDKSLIVTFHDATTRLFELPSGTEIGGVRGHQLTPNRLLLATDKRTLISTQYYELRVWDIPDSLAALAKPTGEAFAQITVDGQGPPPMEMKPKPTEQIDTVASAVVQTVAGQQVRVVVNNQSTDYVLQATTKYFDAAGKELPASDGPKVYKVGNTVALKVRMPEKQVIEMRLLREAKIVEVPKPADKGVAVKKARVDFVTENKVTCRTLTTAGQEPVKVLVDQQTKLYDKDGKELTLKDVNRILGKGMFVDAIYEPQIGQPGRLLEARPATP